MKQEQPKQLTEKQIKKQEYNKVYFPIYYNSEHGKKVIASKVKRYKESGYFKKKSKEYRKLPHVIEARKKEHLKYYSENYDEIRAKQKARDQTPERKKYMLNYARQWREDNREKIRTYQREYGRLRRANRI